MASSSCDNKDGSSKSLTLTEAQLVLLYSGEFADATVRRKNVEWKVHRSILCTRSSYFAACLDGNFQEGLSGFVEFKEEEPYAVEGLLIFLYTMEYPKRSSSFFLQPRPLQQPASGVQATAEQNNQATTTTEAKAVESYSKIQPRSQAATYPWQESMALCRIGDKFGVKRLGDEAIAEIRAAASMALKSSSAMQFFWDFFRLPQDGAHRLRPYMMALAADDVHKLTVSPLFQDFVAANTVFACALVKELGKKVGNAREKIGDPTHPGRRPRGVF